MKKVKIVFALAINGGWDGEQIDWFSRSLGILYAINLEGGERKCLTTSLAASSSQIAARDEQEK